MCKRNLFKVQLEPEPLKGHKSRTHIKRSPTHCRTIIFESTIIDSFHCAPIRPAKKGKFWYLQIVHLITAMVRHLEKCVIAIMLHRTKNTWNQSPQKVERKNKDALHTLYSQTTISAMTLLWNLFPGEMANSAIRQFVIWSVGLFAFLPVGLFALCLFSWAWLPCQNLLP